MPQTRDQRNDERITALIEALVAEGVLPEDWRDSIENIDDHGKGRELAQLARESRGPPDPDSVPGEGPVQSKNDE